MKTDKVDHATARGTLGLTGALGPTSRAAAFAVMVAVVLAACAPLTYEQGKGAARGSARASEAGSPATVVDQTDAAESAKSAGPEASIFRGSGRVIDVPKPRPPINLDGEAVTLNFEQAPLAEVVHAILGDTLALDYVIEHPVKGEITLRTRSPIPRDQLLSILESVLRNNNVLMVRGPNDRFFISGSQNMRSTVPGFDSAPSTGFSNVIVPLQYISAGEMAEILKPVSPEDAFVRIDGKRNLLILAGTQTQLEGWLDIVATFDVDQLAGMSVGIFPLNNSTVEDVFLELQHIMQGMTGGGGDKKPGMGGLVRIMPLERLNSILAVSPRPHYIDQVGAWVEKLDTIEESSADATLHVYPVKNGNAQQLANLLGQIYGGGGGSAAPQTTGVAPGLTQASTGGAGGGGVDSAMPDTGSGATGGASFELGDDVRVVSDSYNNALLVYAPQYEFDRISRILEKLDVVATQVLIEASIIEVTLTDELQYGLEWAFENNLGGGDTGSGFLGLGTSSAIGPKVPGFSYTLTNSAEAVKVALNALAQKSLINVISTPSVMVLDNHTAAIHVGDQQPIQNQQVVTNGGNVSSSITYKDTGVKLQVTPSVNDGGLVTMDIEQSVTDVGPVDNATRQRSFLERNVSSRVAIRSGESVVLGGLIRDNASTGRSGVPLLMDIPLLGNLFSSNTNSGVRTELLVFITPRVLESDQDLRDLSREMRARMKGLTNFEDLPIEINDSPEGD